MLGSPAGKARRSLATSLWRLRRTLQAADPLEHTLAVSDRNTVAFGPTGPYWFDVHSFEQDAAFGLQGTLALEPPYLGALKTAVELYRGDLLQDCYDDGCLVDVAFTSERTGVDYVIFGYQTAEAAVYQVVMER